MNVKMIEKNSATTDEAISQFERERKIRLPLSYRKFLLHVNGGVPSNSLYPVKDRPHASYVNVQAFMGIGTRWPTTELAYGNDLYAGGLPEGIILIANEDFGNYTCLDVRDGRERVAFWDKRHYWGAGEWREQDLYDVADSFEEFLALLGPNNI